jgi:nucleotide-binding universal stress UspA family protein
MYKCILVALDGSRSARLALEEALKLALAADATVIVASVAVYPLPLGYPMSGVTGILAFDTASQAAARQELEHARQLCARRAVRASTQLVDAHGATIPSAIMQAAQAFEADLITMGTHGGRRARCHLLGSVAETVLRSSDVPVLMVRDDSFDEAFVFQA